MLFRRPRQEEIASSNEARPGGDLHEWVRSLPWVVERRYSLATPGVRCFGVECEPLGLRRLWLLTGLVDNTPRSEPSVAVIVPLEAADDIEHAGWGRRVSPMPHEHVLMSVDGSACDRRRDVEALVLTAYSYAMS
jgi:hypothetical protein